MRLFDGPHLVSVSDGREIDSMNGNARHGDTIGAIVRVGAVCSFVPHLEIVRKVSRIGLHAFAIFIPFASSDVCA